MTVETKKCLWCDRDFIQAGPPKATQVYCSYACHCEARRGSQ